MPSHSADRSGSAPDVHMPEHRRHPGSKGSEHVLCCQLPAVPLVIPTALPDNRTVSSLQACALLACTTSQCSIATCCALRQPGPGHPWHTPARPATGCDAAPGPVAAAAAAAAAAAQLHSCTSFPLCPCPPVAASPQRGSSHLQLRQHLWSRYQVACCTSALLSGWPRSLWQRRTCMS
jgi:hypothetical protein